MIVDITEEEIDAWYISWFSPGKEIHEVTLGESKGLQECYNLVELLDKFKVTRA